LPERIWTFRFEKKDDCFDGDAFEKEMLLAIDKFIGGKKQCIPVKGMEDYKSKIIEKEKAKKEAKEAKKAKKEAKK
jgi:hypothetical protein